MVSAARSATNGIKHKKIRHIILIASLGFVRSTDWLGSTLRTLPP